MHMYYGNAAAEDGQRVAEVWSNDYEAVYHLSESGDTFQNSVAPLYQGNNGGTTAIAGAVGGARNFNGSTAHIKLNNHQPMEILQNATGMTITSWILPNEILDSSRLQSIVGIGIGGDTCVSQSRATTNLDNVSGGELLLSGRGSDSDPAVGRRTSTVGLVEDSWYLVSGVFDANFFHGTDSEFPYGLAYAVVNATPHSVNLPLIFSEPATAGTPAQCSTIGAEDDLSGDFFSGAIDEVRISRVDRSTIWLQAQYQSMQDDGFIVFGAAEAVDTVIGE